MRPARRPFLAALLLAAALAPSAARAQFRYGGGPAGSNPYGQTMALAQASNRATTNILSAANPGPRGFSYGPYNAGYATPYGYAQDPTAGYMSGAADVVAAAGQYEMSHQQANLTAQQVKSAHIDNRKKMFDQLRYEQANTPPLSSVEEERRVERLRQMRNDAPLPQIWNGFALNTLYKDVRKFETQSGLRGAVVPLDPELLKHLSLTTGASGTTNASVGLLRDGGKLRWPLSLQDDRFDVGRQEVDKLLPQLVEQARGEGVSGKALKQLTKALDGLVDAVNAAIDDMTPTENIHAMKYLREVKTSLAILRDPNAAKVLGGAWAARGDTVGELMDFMGKNGLTFAPAAPGDEANYTALYGAMVTYDSSLMSLANVPTRWAPANPLSPGTQGP